MKNQLKGKELEERAMKLGVSFHGLGTQSGLIDEAELQKRVREAEKLRNKWVAPFIATIVGGIVVAIVVIFFLEPFKEKVLGDKTTQNEKESNAFDHTEKIPSDRSDLVFESKDEVESKRNKKKANKGTNVAIQEGTLRIGSKGFYEVYYPIPYASPPELTFTKDSIPLEWFDLFEQRRDGFKINVLEYSSGGGASPAPDYIKYIARGIQTK